MNDLIQNYELILKELTNICSHITNFKQTKQSKLSDLELVARNPSAEYLSYNSGLHLFRAIKRTYLDANYALSNYELIGDKGYIRADYQLDLFNYVFF
jgi:hypothetical protein